MRFSTLLFFSIAAATMAPAQQIGLKGPVEGFLFDRPTKSLRAVMGVPGSAIFGPSLSDGLSLASVAPHQNYAIAFQAGNCLFLSGLDSPPASVSVLSGIGQQPDDIVWSTDGSLALLYSWSANRIQTVTGFPSAPAAGAYLDLSSLGGTLSAIATDAHGKRIAVGIEGAAGGVYLTSDKQSFVPVISSPQVVALTFSDDGNSLYALDKAVPQLLAVDLKTFSSQTLPLGGLSDPLSLRTDQDVEGQAVLYVASGSDQTLRIIDLGSRQVLKDMPLSIPPSQLDPLGRHSFLLTSRSRGNEPLWLFTSTPQPVAYFVPAVSAPVLCRHLPCIDLRRHAGGLR
jgi:hypothetical protein